MTCGHRLLLLRLTVGLTLAAHGTQKVFGWFSGPGLDAIGQIFETLGFLAPVAAALVFSVMLVAAVTVHIKQGFFVTSGGYEYTLVLGIAGLTAAFTGPGSLSLDALVVYSVSGAFWDVAAFFVGLLGGAFQLALRPPAPQQTKVAS